MRIYMAGPITGLSYKGATDWREAFRNHLLFDGRGDITCLSPMRLKEHLAHVDSLEATGYDDEVLDSRAVVGRDVWDVRSADVILVNLAGAERISIGTMCELGFAAALNKMIVTIMPRAERSERPSGNGDTDSSNPHDHLFVYELSTIIVEDLDTAAVVIEAL